MLRSVTNGVMRAASVVGGAVRVVRGTPFERLARDLAGRLAQRTRPLRSSWSGIRYRAGGRRPDPDVPDDVLADRVRSALGPAARRLDIPHVHVMAHDRVVTLHGVVASAVDAHELEYAAHRVSGVHGVTSYLHVGFGPSDVRPSEGRAREPSSVAHDALVRAARDAGVPPGAERRAIRAVLASFLERVPVDEREQVLGHLPRDARELAAVPRRHGEVPLRTLDELDDEIARVAGVDPLVADALSFTVLGALRRLVPEEIADVGAVLPAGLRDAWTRAGDYEPARGA
jgi:uncharacterized protein (DUF2267 family)